MSTNKIKLGGVRISPDIHISLKRLHGRIARIRKSTGNNITFSSYIEEILADYVRDKDKMAGVIGRIGIEPAIRGARDDFYDE